MKKAALILTVLLICGMLFVSASAEIAGTNSDHGENAVLFAPDATITHKNLCEMSGLYAEVLDDAAIAEGWYYYYTDTDENPANVIIWDPSEGNYTTAEALFTMKNISGLPQTFGDKITAVFIFRENETVGPICYEGTVFQQNPGQIDENGQMIMWSTKPIEIAAGESANVSFRFDIPKDTYEKIYAALTGADTGIGMTCEFDFGDETTYVIDLNDSMILASQYEF